MFKAVFFILVTSIIEHDDAFHPLLSASWLKTELSTYLLDSRLGGAEVFLHWGKLEERSKG